MSFDWDKAKKEAGGLDDKELTQRAGDAASAFVVLWREADSRASHSDFRLSVSILQDRIGILVDGYRISKL